MYILTVIVPVYNIPDQLLRNCLESLLSQSLKDIEYIIVNDCSPNLNNIQVIKEYALRDNRIRIINLLQNKGVSNARNMGLEIASGKYVAFFDADDIYDKDMCKIMIRLAEQHNVDVVECNTRRYLDEEQKKFIDTFFPDRVWELSDISDDRKRILFYQDFAHGCSDKIYRRISIGNVRFMTGLTNYEDYIFNWLVLSKSKKAISIKNICYFMSYRKDSASRFLVNIEKYERIYKSIFAMFNTAMVLSKEHELLSKYLLINLLNLGLVNKGLFARLKDVDELKAYEVARKNYLQYMGLSKKYLPLDIRLLLKWRMRKQKGYLSFPDYLYYLLKICIKCHLWRMRV